MTFSHIDYTFHHSVNTADTSRPVVFSLDLSNLINADGYSALFSVDSLSINAYRRGSWDKMPVKFALLNGNRTRAITYDPTRLSSKWSVDLGLQDAEVSHKDHGEHLCVTIAGIETEPFNRAVPVYADENKRAVFNVLGFMMSKSLWIADKARGALDVMMTSASSEVAVHCSMCMQQSAVRVHLKDSDVDNACIAFPLCTDGCVCAPLDTMSNDRPYRAVCAVMALIRRAYDDKLDGMLESNAQLVTDDFEFMPCNNQQRNVFVVSYASLKRLSGLYQALSEYADTFAMVDAKRPTIKVLFESCCDTIGLVTGSVGITTIYGSSVCDVYANLRSHHHQHSGVDAEDDLSPCQLDVGSQLTPDVMLRQISLSFDAIDRMNLDVWRRYFFRAPPSTVLMSRVF